MGAIPAFICSTPLQLPVRSNSSASQVLSACLSLSLLPMWVALGAVLLAGWLCLKLARTGAKRRPLAIGKMVKAKSAISALDMSLLWPIAIFVRTDAYAERPLSEFYVWCTANICFSFSVLVAYLLCIRLGVRTSGWLHAIWAARLTTLLPLVNTPLFGAEMNLNHAILAVNLLCAAAMTVLLWFADFKVADDEDGAKNGHETIQMVEEPAQKGVTDSKAQKCHPESYCSAASAVMFAYASELVRIGLRGELSYDQIWQMQKRNKASYLNAQFCAATKQGNALEDRTKWGTASFLWLLLRATWQWQLAACALALAVIFVLCANALFLNAIVDWTAQKYPLWLCLSACVGLFALNLVGKVSTVRRDYDSFVAEANLNAILSTAIFDKMMKLSAPGRARFSTGELITLLAVDLQRFRIWWWLLRDYIYTPLMSIVAFVGLFVVLGWNVLLGLVAILTMFPVNYLVAKLQAHYQTILMDLKDERIRLLTDVLAGIKMLKLCAWEESMERRVFRIRRKEARIVRILFIVDAVATVFYLLTPILALLLSFYGYTVLQERQLTPGVAFVSLIFFNILRVCVYFLPNLVTTAVQSLVSVRRILHFLVEHELQPSHIEREANEGGGEVDHQIVSIENCSFSWGEPTSAKEKAVEAVEPPEASKCEGDAQPENDSEATALCEKGEQPAAVEEKTEEPAQQFRLHSIDLAIARGELVAVVGRVGSGKSSLLSAILGEMLRMGPEGDCRVRAESIGWLPQQVWLQNKTVRENILFGAPFEPNRYAAVLQGCALAEDLNALAAGDQTEIGEKGINLSGGQKARIALARAVYQQAQLYLLDDILAAVDASVGRHLFERVIGNTADSQLRHSTRLCALNTLTLLPQFGRVLVLEAGRIVANGSCTELAQRAEGPFAELMRDYLHTNLDAKAKQNDAAAAEEEDEQRKQIAGLLAQMCGTPLGDSLNKQFGQMLASIRAAAKFKGALAKRRKKAPAEAGGGEKGEEVAQQQQEKETLQSNDAIAHQAQQVKELHDKNVVVAVAVPEQESKQPLLAEEVPNAKEPRQDGQLTDEEEMQGGIVSRRVFLAYVRAFGLALVGAFFACTIVATALGAFANVWLAEWSAAGEAKGANDTAAATTQQRSLHIYAGVNGLYVLSTAVCCLVVAVGAYRASLAFHNALVSALFRSPMAFFERTPAGRIMNRLSADIEKIDQVIPWNIANSVQTLAEAVAALGAVCLVIPLLALVVVPLIAIFCLIVNLYNKAAVQFRRLSANSSSLLYAFVQNSYSGADSIRAFAATDQFKLAFCRVIDLSNECFLADQITNKWMQLRLNMAADVALFVCMLAAVCLASEGLISLGALAMIIAAASTFTNYLGEIARSWRHVEADMVSVERVRAYTHNEPEAPWHVPNALPMEGKWPSAAGAAVAFHNVCLRYRQGLDPALCNVSFSVAPGQRIGIVGRSGAGKSSLLMALFRIVEPCSGQILVDAVDISRIGLHDLRKAFTIVPQDPVLFCGSLRFNLDPFDEHSDAQIWEALEKAHLADRVRTNFDAKLAFNVAEGGANLSVGERQQLCLARALLRSPCATAVLALDEATAAIDAETDAHIQRSIRAHFAHSTVLTVAHRLHTVLDHDLVLVMHKGAVAEFDSPKVLLEQPDSMFAKLARSAGIPIGVGRERKEAKKAASAAEESAQNTPS